MCYKIHINFLLSHIIKIYNIWCGNNKKAPKKNICIGKKIHYYRKKILGWVTFNGTNSIF